MEQTTLATRPLVSVVTPFHNTAPYLAECIESVLAQSYENFEYILVDNVSTDGSSEIAESYARRDPRVRLFKRSQLLPQLRNYNDALTKISGTSQYCKLVQADDWIFPQCLELMVRAFEQSESIGLVSSYWLEAIRGLSHLQGSGYPYPLTAVSGKDCARLYFHGGAYVFGSQSTVMYRSGVVRESQSFYDESLPNNADFDKCMQILRRWDFGFVHELLSFTRRDNESLISARLPFRPFDMDRYVIVRRYASAFLEPGEAATVIGKAKRGYYRTLAREALRFRGPAFWQYHQTGLKTVDETIDWPYLVRQTLVVLAWICLNPGQTIRDGLRAWKQRKQDAARQGQLAAKPAAVPPEPVSAESRQTSV